MLASMEQAVSGGGGNRHKMALLGLAGTLLMTLMSILQ